MNAPGTRAAMLAILLLAPAAAALAQQPPRESPPPLGTPKEFHLPARRDFTLPNGMRVTLVPFGRIPKVSVYLVVRSGRIDEGTNEVWLSDVTGDMLREGTTSRSAEDIALRLADMGGNLDVNVGDDETQIGGAVLSERGPEMIALVADVVEHPRLPASELARIVANKARDVAIARSQPQPLAQEQFVRALYGAHPYGRLFPPDSMLERYTIEQVRGFYARSYGAARSHLYVVGVYDAAAVERAVRAAFAGWPRGSAPAVKPPSPSRTRTVTLLDRPGAVQSTIILGLPVPSPVDRDYTALSVTDALLGGTFGSRITTNIREQKGYTYSPYSVISTHRHDAYWAEQADVTTQFTGASLHEIFGEIERLQKEAPPIAELQGIKNNMVGIFTLRNASRGGIVNLLSEADLQGLGEDYLSSYVRRVTAVAPADVQRTAVKYLRPEQMTLVVVGDRKVVADQLAPYQRPVTP